jgi:TM2 domain-containing membrane protein YozV
MQTDNPVDGHVDNSLAAIFTMMLPGLGQMLERRIITGLIWSLAVGGGYLLNGWFGMVVHVLCILDAAFYGHLGNFFSKVAWPQRIAMLSGLVALITYTCMRTALF